MNDDTICQECGRQFDTRMGKQKHKFAEHEPDYKNPTWLEKQYKQKGLSINDIAEKVGCSYETVRYWLKKFDIDTRGFAWYVPYADFRTSNTGYERWHCTTNQEYVKSHRLLAVAKYGFEAVKGKHVHHKNGLSWDNRPENIELVDEKKHQQIHQSKVDADLCGELRRQANDHTYEELSEEYGLHTDTIGKHVRKDCHHY